MRRDTRTQTFTGYTAEKIVETFAGGYVDTFFEAGLISDEVLHNSNECRYAQFSSFLDDYAIAQANRSPEQIAEEQMMARDALGNQPIANVITGEIF